MTTILNKQKADGRQGRKTPVKMFCLRADMQTKQAGLRVLREKQIFQRDTR